MAEEFSGTAKGWLSRLPRWARLLLLGLLSVLITKAYETLVDGQTLEKAVAYQEQAMSSLQTVTPQATWLLFRQSLGYDTSAALKNSKPYQDALNRCQEFGGEQLAGYLDRHPEIGALQVREDGEALCIAAIEPLQPGEEAPFIPGDKPDGLARLPADEALRLPPVQGQCQMAYDFANRAQSECMKAAAGSVDGWGQAVLNASQNVSYTIGQWVFKAIAPAAAMADVVRHNYVDWSPGVIFRVVLLVLGLAVSVWLAAKMLDAFGANLVTLAASAAFVPAFAILFATLGAFLSWYAAAAALYISQSFIKLILLPLAVTGGFLTTTAFGAVLEAGKQQTTKAASKKLGI